MTREQIKSAWDWVQSLLDVDGDTMMFFFTGAIIYKILAVGLNPNDAIAYGTAATCFAWSNKGPKAGV